MILPDGFYPFPWSAIRDVHDGSRAEHVHAFYAEIEVIVDLRRDGIVLLSGRADSVRPSNGSKADVRHVIATAAEHFDDLAALWEKHHG